jgi:hypothetical protein
MKAAKTIGRHFTFVMPADPSASRFAISGTIQFLAISNRPTREVGCGLSMLLHHIDKHMMRSARNKCRAG